MKKTKHYHVFNAQQDLYAFIAQSLKGYSLKNEAQHICLSGGSTPKGLFVYLLAHNQDIGIAWHNLHFWWGDERCVPTTSSESNYGEATRLLFRHINIPDENLHPIHYIEGNHQVALVQFLNEMGQRLPVKSNHPKFDWILLGIGEDGHTASLFPHDFNLQAPDHALLVLKPNTDEYRISLSAQTILVAERVSYLVSGGSKAQIVYDILTNQASAQAYPAALISSTNKQIDYLLDSKAGALLPIEEGH